MDTFIDKLAQKFTAQEMIRANSAAEAKENKRLREQVETYEAVIQEMKRLNLKNMESANQVNQLAQEGCDSIKKIMEELTIEKPQDAQKMEELFTQLDDSIHKENVKVYRNVQAVVNDGLNEQTESLKSKLDEETVKQEQNLKKQTSFTKVMSIVILIAVLIDIALQIVRILGIL